MKKKKKKNHTQKAPLKCTGNRHPELVVVSSIIVVDIEVIVVPAEGVTLVVKLTRLLHIISSFLNTLNMM